MKIAVAGVGSMGGAIITGLIKAGLTDITSLNPESPRVKKMAADQGFTTHTDAAALLAEKPDLLILTTPAPVTVEVAQSLAGLPADTVIISAAAGVDMASLKQALPKHPLGRIIPNTPVAVNGGTIGISYDDTTPAAAQQLANDVLSKLGDVIPVPENQLELVGVVGGCGPAFVDVMMDALSDAAVKYGLDRKTSYELIASMVKGSGKLAYDSKLAPALLRDQVTSPAGTTIRGVEALEKAGFRYALIDAVNKSMGN